MRTHLLYGPAVALVFFLLVWPAGASAQRAVALKEKVDSLVQTAGKRFIQDSVHVGLSIGLFWEGLSDTYHYGTTLKGLFQPPTRQSIYEIASLTKTFTGILLAQAVIEHKIQLKDDVRKYLQGKYPALTCQGQPITVESLANHTSGLPKNMPAFPAGQTVSQLLQLYQDFSNERLLQELARVKLSWRPSTHYRYSNAGTQLLGIVLENVYGQSYQALVTHYITQPQQMPHTGTYLPDSLPWVQGYTEQGQPAPRLELWREVPAAGFLKSSPGDMLRYLAWNVAESNPAVALAHRVTFGPTTEHGADIGLCWFVSKGAKGVISLEHGGGGFGTSSYCLILPQDRVGIVCLANDAGAATEGQLRALARQLASQIRHLRQKAR